MGGYKGILIATDFSYFDYGKTIKIVVRPSMRKFETIYIDNEVTLDVIWGCTYSPAFFNNQIFLILWNRWVPAEILIDYAKLRTKEIKCFLNPENINQDTVKFEKMYSMISQFGHFISKEWLIHQYNGLTDPFINCFLRIIAVKLLKDIKKRFWIPLENGCNLVGCIDPYSLIPEGYCFVKINKNWEGEIPFLLSNLTEEVIVTWMPGVNAGDIWRLRVFKPEDEFIASLYENIENVILFSAHGDWPETDKMSGGDCDGDIYWLCWEELIIAFFDEHEPTEPKDKNLKTPFQSVH